jgi:transcription elongation GreA/GreB family factor
MTKLFVSQEGYEEYCRELRRLKDNLTKNAREGSEAYTDAVGDGWHDNFAFEQTMRKEKQITNSIEKMIQEGKKLTIINRHNKKDYIDIGDSIKIKFIYSDNDTEIETYKLTGNYFSNDQEITLNSPLGEAIYNKKIGSFITYKVNNTEIKIQIMEKTN